ncbi:hypothetical protein [Bailinhaonella thermotolerans]|uniref:DUF5808 domain-containing protein n=1 Tax=Bailinhaonella thermotolerans TaxID=1070861 RepID=A0A3A4BAN5_9ACTN|nr:hypothetical protein [Bailinhaonella thermotolerans]RJL31258.1 hypothetical protein D5H75_19550 [Bailinhaonella thermotolerans]
MAGRFRRAAMAAGAGLVAAAVVRELRKPSREREWHGRVAGLPYDFRPPTPARLRRAVWNPEGPLIQPHAFGIGYSVNFARLARLPRRPRR